MSDIRDRHIRISLAAKNQLIKLKRLTGITHWNELCRWAFCRSLSESLPPPDVKISGDSNVEMTWRVFAGNESEIYLALLKKRCRDEGKPTDEDSLAEQLRLHIHRGIGYLASDRKVDSIEGLLRIAVLTPRN